MTDYTNAQGQVLIMYGPDEPETPRSIMFLRTDGKETDWESMPWSDFEEGARSERYESTKDFVIAYARRHMLEHDIDQFEMVVCNVAGSETIDNIDPENN